MRYAAVVAQRKSEYVMTGWINLIQAHLMLALAVVLGVAVVAYFKPKQMFKLLGAAIIVVAVVYVLSFLVNLTSTGIDETTKFLDRQQNQPD